MNKVNIWKIKSYIIGYVFILLLLLSFLDISFFNSIIIAIFNFLKKF